MESGPAIFAGAVFALFGGALTVWTGVRVRNGEPVAHGVRPVASTALAALAAMAALGAGLWCFTQV